MTSVRVGRRSISVSHPDKVLFPDAGITKADLVSYYRAVAGPMLGHVRGRPVMMERYPEGVSKKGFLQKDVPDWFPGWVPRVKVTKAGGTITHAVCDDQTTIVYLASQNCVTFHVWLSRADQLERPDRLIFDLDPATEDDFELVRTTAQALRHLLEDLGLVPFVKTSGSRGLHVEVPLTRREGFDGVRAFARDAATVLVRLDPERLTIETRKASRGGRLFVDTLRNGYAQTAVAPYSVRPRPTAPVATPLVWDELDDRSLRPDSWTVANVPERLAASGDPWAAMTRRARSLSQPRRRLDRLLADSDG